MVYISLAKTKYIRMSPRKVRVIADLIRGKTYSDALQILQGNPRMAVGPIWKTLYSAAANATNKYGIKKKKLIIQEIYVSEGPILRRGRPRAQGRVFQIKKRTSHITIKLALANPKFLSV